MRKYVTPLEIKGEEKIIGGRMSLRQGFYTVVGIAVAYILASILHRILGTFLPSPIPAIVTVMLFPLPVVPFLAFAFLPAGFMFLPGPSLKQSDDPFDAPMRLDEWLLLMWRQRKKQKLLSYRPVRTQRRR